MNKKYKVYRCVGGPPAGLRQRAARVARTGADAKGPEGEPPAGQPPEPMDLGHLRRFNELVLRSMPAGLVLIDRAYRIVSTNPAARRLLQVHDYTGEPDFLHAVRGIPYNEVRAAIDAAFRDRSVATLPELSLPSGSEDRYVHLTVGRIHSEPNSTEYAVVTVVDVTETVRAARRLKVSQEEQRMLVEELSTTNKRLAELNKDLQDANEELQAANEELMLAQEEMQATNEELETTNDELSARSAELQEMTRRLASERARLAEMVELAPFCLMVMKGPALVVDAANPAAERVLALARDSLRHPFEAVFSSQPWLVECVRGAYREDKAWTSRPQAVRVGQGAEAESGAERTYVFTAVPTHDEFKVDGVVLYGEDVTGFPDRS